MGQTLSDVPVRVATSRLAPEVHVESLRFYQNGNLLPYELEGQGRSAWVRVGEIVAEGTTEIQAVMGATCPDLPERLPTRNVWSAGYVAVFHFDAGDNSPLVFVDSVHGIELLADDNTEVGEAKGFLGPHARKLGDARLEATDPRLDLSGGDEISTLGWVQLEGGQAGFLPWDGENARHRELVAKLPGYRLNAVGGEATAGSDLMARPFFNLSQEIPGELQDNVFGPAAVLANDWTMLAGTYDGTLARLFLDGELVGTESTDYTPGSDGEGTMGVGRWLHGGVDEIRISNVVRSPSWIRIQHASMTDTLLDYGDTVQLDP